MRFTLWCCFEPETGDIHRFHIAHHVQRQFHPGWNLTAANTSNTNESKQEPMAWPLHANKIASPDSGGSCIPRLPEEYLFPPGVLFLLALKAKLPELPPMIYCLDLEVTARHFLTISSDWKAAIWHSSRLIQYRIKWVVWSDKINDYWLHTKDSNQLPSSNN